LRLLDHICHALRNVVPDFEHCRLGEKAEAIVAGGWKALSGQEFCQKRVLCCVNPTEQTLTDVDKLKKRRPNGGNSSKVVCRCRLFAF
jgi:hypothetical protein